MTKQQKQEAEAAIYGLARSPITMDQSQQQFTPEQLEQMRQILAQHDGHKPGVIKEFDLNNPPKEPYRFQEFPKMVYDHDNRKPLVVRNAKEERSAREAGYVLEPYPSEVAPAPAEDDDAEEIARLDKVARKPRQAKAE